MHSAIFTFKCAYMAPNSFNDYFKLHQPKYLLRKSKMKLLVPRIKLQFAERSVLVSAPKNLIKLPVEVRLETS